MKNYKLSLPTEVKAFQFKGLEKLEDSNAEMFSLCESHPYEKNTLLPIPSDFLGSSPDAFFGFNNNGVWEKIELNSWIIQKGKEYVVLSEGMFKLLNND